MEFLPEDPKKRLLSIVAIAVIGLAAVGLIAWQYVGRPKPGTVESGSLPVATETPASDKAPAYHFSGGHSAPLGAGKQ